MPKRKKLPQIPDYKGFSNNSDESYIQKARPLQSLATTDLTLPEFKILDVYLARINSHEPTKRTVKFEKGELEQLLGVSRILKSDLDKRLRHLFQVVEVKDESKRKGFKLINLFEEADAEQDDNGLWQVTLTCTASAREYIFNIDNIGYLRYRLKNVINLKSRYSYVLFLYLLDNRFRKKWTISLTHLKTLLNCNAESYNQFYRFNDLILKKCQNEINAKTDLQFSYKAIKHGRKISDVEFTVNTVSDKLEDDIEYTQQILTEQQTEQLTFDNDDEFEEEEINYGGELADLLGNASCDDEFSPEQIRVLQDLVLQVVGHDHMQCCDYLSHKVHIMNLYNPKRENRFTYLVKMIKNDIKDPDSAL